jgi:tRNA splicing endonuclease
MKVYTELRGKRVYVGDGIKVGKEGRKMPGVKRLHQESEDVSKPEWIQQFQIQTVT